MGSRKLTRQAAINAPGKSNANNRHGEEWSLCDGSCSCVCVVVTNWCGVAGGERNAVGAGVWKRVRLKLEGRDDLQAARRYTLHDQVGVGRGAGGGGGREAAWLTHVRVAGGPYDKGSCMLWEPVHDVRGLDGVGLSPAPPLPRLRHAARARGPDRLHATTRGRPRQHAATRGSPRQHAARRGSLRPSTRRCRKPRNYSFKPLFRYHVFY